MPITRKPVRPSDGESSAVDVDGLIAKGGSVATRSEGKRKPRPLFVQLRLDKELIAKIDRDRNSRPIKIPRHMWLLEAIHEKLARKR